MNIKITIKDAESGPMLIHKNQLSETEFRKKNTLYQQPQRDRNPQKKEKTVNNPAKGSRDEKGLRQTGLRSSGEDESYRKAEQKMMQDFDKLSKNQVSMDMIHNSNNILQKQNEILEENQKTLFNMTKNNQNRQTSQNEAKDCQNLLGQIKREVDQMKKIKEQIERASRQFTRTLNQTGKEAIKHPSFQGVPNNITEMNSNLKNLAEISKNQLEGLQNMEAIKSLQNFNMQGYSQAINSLKRQIIQYQKESEQIQRQLKLRSAKLQKMDIKPNFDEQMLAPYEAYLKKKADAVDLYAIREKVFQKLGVFDYGKFQNDITQIMSDVRSEMNDFYIACKQYRIDVPDIKMDQKELKGLDLKLPSAIEEFKAERGINFARPSESRELNNTDRLYETGNRNNRKKGEAILSMKGQKPSRSQKISQGIRELNSKPVDLTTQVKFQKTNEPTQKTVLENEREKNKKLVQTNMKKMRKGKQDEDFQKYLQYRAREELELLYKQKKERLEKKQDELYQFCKEEPEIYLNLNLRNEIRRDVSRQKKQEEKKSPKKSLEKKQIKKQEIDQEEEEKIPKLRPIPGTEGQTIKEVGTDVLKEKLRNLLGGNNAPRRAPENYQQHFQQMLSPPQVQAQPEPRLQNVAENFLSMINNTITQVNNNLSKTIQTKYEHRSLSREKYENYRKSPIKLNIPQLEEIKPPPAFNMPVYNPSEKPPTFYQPTYPTPLPQSLPEKPKMSQKIVQKNYDHLKIKDQADNDDLEISQSYIDDFE